MMHATVFENKDSAKVTAHHRKGAALLNNMGVSLLQNGAFGDAMRTLHDAVLVMSNVCCTKNALSPQDAKCLGVTTNCLAQARERLASPNACPMFMVQPALEYDAPTPPFSFLDLEDYHHFEIEENSFHHPYHIFICAVGVEPNNCSCRCGNGSVDFARNLDSAIMTYNLGLSYVCISKCQPEAELRRGFEDAAIHLFAMSESILQQCQEYGDKSHKEDCNRFDRKGEHIALIRMAVLHMWYQVLAQRYTSTEIADSIIPTLDNLMDLQGTLWRYHDAGDEAPLSYGTAAACA